MSKRQPKRQLKRPAPASRRWLLVLAIVALGGLWYGTRAPEHPAVPVDIVAATRAAADRGDYATGVARVTTYRETHGLTPEGIEALSWLGRGALAAGDLERAETFAQQTHVEAQELLASRPLDAETRLPLALGAAIEVLGQAAAARGARTEALTYLQGELARYRDTSIAMRIQKNINLISLEGTPAPALDLSEHIGAVTPRPMSALAGRVVLLFFWAHWCSDCKAQAPVLASLMDRYGEAGLSVVAPTQRYGYVAAARPAPPDEERQYIEAVRREFYPMLGDVAIPLATANHQRYGVSTTPTIVLVDRAGTIRLFHPGRMPQAELEPMIEALLAAPSTAPSTTG